MKFLNPLTILHIGFFPFDVFGKLFIAEDNLHLGLMQIAEQTLPVLTGAFHRYRKNELILFCRSHSVRACRSSLYTPNFFYIFRILSDGHKRGTAAYINTGSVGVDDLQGRFFFTIKNIFK